LSRRRAVLDARLMTRSRKLFLGECGSQVDEGACDRRDRDAIADPLVMATNLAAPAGGHPL
jgi:hypothetical protein